MDREADNNFHGHGSMFMGAIFMSNRMTKQECLKRKLFGLPSSKTWFMKKLKAGMLLFLFENEERKLYGVFEATSDGALNIMPNAFISSGNSYPAQILFKRVWMCKPLSEVEFRDAIKENYFTPNKFHFGLSYEQVFKLIHLFSLKRIRLQQHQRPGVPNKIIKDFEKAGGDKVRVTGEGRSMKFNSNEQSTDDGINSNRNPGLYATNTNRSMSHEKLITTKQASFVSIGRGSYQMPPRAIEPRLSTSPNYHYVRVNFPAHPSLEDRDYHYFPGSGSEIPSATLGMDYPSLPHEPITCIRSSMDMQAPHFRCQLHPMQTSPNALNSSPNYRGSSFPVYNPSNICLPPIHSEGYRNPQIYKHISHPEHCDPSSPRISFSKPGMIMAKGIDSLPSMHSPCNVQGHPGALRQKFDSREQQRWGLGPSSDYIPLSGDNNLGKNRESFHFLNSPQKDSSGSSSESGADDESEELRPYLQTHADEYYPTAVNSMLHSDAEQSRTSVFSRISKAPEAPWKSEVARKQVTSLSLEQLVSQRRNEITEVCKHSIIQDGDEQFESVAEMEPSGVASLGDVLESSSDAIVEESSELPFLNFKRRSEIRKTPGENEKSVYSESGEDEGLSGRYKRRKLVRPCLSEEECRNVQGLSREIVGVETLVENSEERNTENGESFVRNHKSGSVPEASLGGVASDKTENDYEGLRHCRKELSISNAQWSLLKSIAGNAKASIVDREGDDENANNASHLVSGEVSVLPVYSRGGDEEIGDIDKVNVASSVDEKEVESEDFLPL